MTRRRLFGRNDEAVTEVIGYVLSFALSAIFLLIALNVFWAAKANTESVTTGVELKTIADQVAARVVELSSVSQEFPNATHNATMKIPQSLDGQLYTVKATRTSVTVTTNDGSLSAASTTFKADAIVGLKITGSLDSSNELIQLEYRIRTDPDTPSDPAFYPVITIKGG